jgi:hypothetical protein
MTDLEDMEAKERRARQRRFRRLAKEVARPDTSPEELRRLYDLSEQDRQEHWDENTIQPLRDAIAAHPNTLLSLLKEVAWDSLDAFLTNPILPLIPLESPEFFDELSESLCLRLLTRANVPASIVRLLTVSLSEVVAEAARLHISQGEARAEWRTEVQGILEAMPAPPRTEDEHFPEKPWQEFADVGLFPQWWEKWGVAPQPVTIPEPIAPLRYFSTKNIVFPETPEPPPPGGWETLRKKDVAARIVLARTVTLAPEALTFLAEDKDKTVRLSVAQNPKSPPEALIRLIGSGDKINDLVVQHPRATMLVWRVLVLLGSNGFDANARRLLQHPRLSPRMLMVLAKHEHPEVRRIVYQHTRSRLSDGTIHPKILRRLHKTVLEGLWHELGYGGQEGEENGRDFWSYLVLTYPETPVRILRQVAQIPLWLIRFAVAEHPKTPEKIRQQLAEWDGNRYVRAAARESLTDV